MDTRAFHAAGFHLGVALAIALVFLLAAAVVWAGRRILRRLAGRPRRRQRREPDDDRARGAAGARRAHVGGLRDGRGRERVLGALGVRHRHARLAPARSGRLAADPRPAHRRRRRRGVHHAARDPPDRGAPAVQGSGTRSGRCRSGAPPAHRDRVGHRLQAGERRRLDHGRPDRAARAVDRRRADPDRRGHRGARHRLWRPVPASGT